MDEPEYGRIIAQSATLWSPGISRLSGAAGLVLRPTPTTRDSVDKPRNSCGTAARASQIRALPGKSVAAAHQVEIFGVRHRSPGVDVLLIAELAPPCHQPFGVVLDQIAQLRSVRRHRLVDHTRDVGRLARRLHL